MAGATLCKPLGVFVLRVPVQAVGFLLARLALEGAGLLMPLRGMLIATLVVRGLERLPGLPASMLEPLERLVSRDWALGMRKHHTLRFHMSYLI